MQAMVFKKILAYKTSQKKKLTASRIMHAGYIIMIKESLSRYIRQPSHLLRPLLVLAQIIRLLQKVPNVVVAGVPGGMDHDPCGGVALLGQAEATVADPPAGRTYPLVVQEDLAHVFSIAVLETGAAELTTNLGGRRRGQEEKK